MELVEAMRTQHACRYYRPDPVPADVFHRAVEAARFGPQGGNRQPVRFLIVTDAAKRRQLAEWYLVPWKAYVAAALSDQEAIEAESGDEKATHVLSNDPARALAAADDFAEHFADHPAIVVVLANLADTHPTDTDLGRLSIVGGASVYPGVQNLCLALRDQGVATTLTTLLCVFEPQVKELLGIPAELSTAAFIVAGYPARPFPTGLTRRPVEEIAFLDDLDHPSPPTPDSHVGFGEVEGVAVEVAEREHQRDVRPAQQLLDVDAGLCHGGVLGLGICSSSRSGCRCRSPTAASPMRRRSPPTPRSPAGRPG